MKVLFLLVNSACNIACTYCFYTMGYEKRSRNRIRPEIADHVAKRIASVGFGTVILTGGDPLHSLFKRETYMLVGKLKSQGCKVIVNTSAALLTDDDLDTIIALGVDRIDVSIDSHDPGVNDVQRGCHADAVRAIAGLIERGCRSVVTTTVVTSVNAPTLPETVLWLRSLGVEDVRIQRVFLPGDKCNENDIVQSGMHVCRNCQPRMCPITSNSPSGCFEMRHHLRTRILGPLRLAGWGRSTLSAMLLAF